MQTGRLGLRAIAVFGTLMAAVAAGASSELRAADYEFQAEYRISLNGLSIGRAVLQASFEGAQYRIDGSAKLTGIAGMLFDFSSTAAAAGRLRANRPQPTAFSADSNDGRRKMSVRMTLANNAVRNLRLEPPITPEQERHPELVPITAVHRRGIIDPVSAMIGFGGFNGESFDRSLCNRSVPIFNGRERFDVQLEFSEISSITSSGTGYSGPALVCRARYRAIAGHRANKDEVKHLEEKLVFDVMLAPIEGSDLVVPYRVSVSTPLGNAAITASALSAKGSLTTRSAALAD